jgi:hypothetical protein
MQREAEERLRSRPSEEEAEESRKKLAEHARRFSEERNTRQ